jgi:hypothetical protein
MDKAQLALNLLRDDFFIGEIEQMKANCHQVFENSKPDDYESREDAYRRLKSINELISHFEAIAAEKQMVAKRWKIL